MRAFALLLASAAAGCASDVTDSSFVDGLRLLGVHAEPPEAAPGETVVLQAWPVDTHGRSLAVSWSACLLPSNGLANPACITGSDGRVALGSGDTISMVVPPISREQLGPADATDGVYLPIVVHVSVPNDSVDAVYRLRIAGTLPPNQNPVFATIEKLPDDPDLPIMTHAGQRLVIRAQYTNDSQERYDIRSIGDNRFETLTTQWFSTAGTFLDPISGGLAFDTFTMDRKLPPPGGVVDVWAVGHDDRGGTALTHRTLVMQ